MSESEAGVDSLAQLRAIATQAPSPVTEQSLRTFLERQPELRAGNFQVIIPNESIAAGASGGLLMFEIEATGDAAPMTGRYVLRYELGEGSYFKQTSLPAQFQLMRALLPLGIPAADAAWLDESGEVAGGSTSLIMRRVDARAPVIQYVQAGLYVEATTAERETMVRSLIQNLARLHALPIQDMAIDQLGNRDGRDPNFITNEIDWAVRELHARFPENEEGERAELHSSMRRVLTEAAARLREAVPTGVKPVLVHGDPTLANTMFHPDGSAAAILDWELAHAGIGAEDPYYFIYAARSIASLGGVKVELPKIEDALRYYEEAGGSLDQLEFASALTALRINIWGAMGMRRMPKAHWGAERLTWETQSSMLSDAMAKI